MDYVRWDANYDASQKIQSPDSVVTIELKEDSKASLPSDAKLSIFEFQNDQYYFLNHDTNPNDTKQLLVIPKSQIEKIAVTKNAEVGR